jgi:hypothetical protein
LTLHLPPPLLYYPRLKILEKYAIRNLKTFFQAEQVRAVESLSVVQRGL